MMFSVCLIVLLLAISHFTVHSVPIRDMVEEQQPVKVTRREDNADPMNIQENLEAREFTHELTSAALPSYLKDLYANFNFPSKSRNTLKNQKLAEANTIRSYENKANGKLFIKGSAHLCLVAAVLYAMCLKLSLNYFLQVLVVDITNLTSSRTVLMERK